MSSTFGTSLAGPFQVPAKMEEDAMRIAVIGTGYVGLVSGACFAELGTEVWCVDQDVEKIEALRRGHIPIFEPQLEDIVTENLRTGRLHFCSDMALAVPDARAVFITVGTPETDDGGVDLSQVFAAAAEAARHVSGQSVFVTKSTVPVGTSRRVAAIAAQANPRADIAVASNPEFLREGSAVTDFMRPDRVTYGAEEERARAVLRRLYRPLRLSGVPVEETSLETAELSKYACNGFLAAKVTFINEIADLCEAVDADVEKIRRTMGLDSRIGPKFLNPGPGFGGSCFPKDTRGLAHFAQSAGVSLRIIDAVIAANADRKKQLVERVRRVVGRELAGLRIGVLGVTFKADTDDVRASPALDLLPALATAGALVRVYDPKGIGNLRRSMGSEGFIAVDSPHDAALGAACLVILTEWDEFREMSLIQLGNLMQERTVVDFRNLFDPHAMAMAGFRYHGIGRPVAVAQDASFPVAAE